MLAIRGTGAWHWAWPEMAATHVVQDKDASLPIEGGMHRLANKFERRNWGGLAGPLLPRASVKELVGCVLSAPLLPTTQKATPVGMREPEEYRTL